MTETVTHPQPGFFETTVAEDGTTAERVLEIMARPKWTLDACKARVAKAIGEKQKTQPKQTTKPMRKLP